MQQKYEIYLIRYKKVKTGHFMIKKKKKKKKSQVMLRQ